MEENWIRSGTMSDRFGPSEDCEVCGEPQSYGHFIVCAICEKTMCDYCFFHNHDCCHIYTEESANEAYTKERDDKAKDSE